MPSNYKPTGYPRGRPRKGEIRPPSPNAIYCANYRKARLAQEPDWKKHLAKLQADWRVANLERSRAQKRACYARKKAWEESGIRGI